MEQILITPRSFGKTDPTPFTLIREAGYEILENKTGGILSKEQMIEAIASVAGVIIGVDPLDREVISAGKSLRAIAKYGVGTDNIDVPYAKECSIKLSTTAGANSNAVADYAFTLMLACARRVCEINARCHQGDWGKVIGTDLYGKTLGILGLGAIGKGVAKRAQGFDMNILAYDVFWDEAYAQAHGIRQADPNTIFSCCDFISLHLPLNNDTLGIVNADAFRRMKRTAILINTARGGLIDESALIQALSTQQILAAGIDVFEKEPPENTVLYSLPNLVMGSHCAASTVGASEAMSLLAVQNLLSDL
ncbi:MAG TPA: phosphoglycerate dehydrogenase [Clostridia bacterium]|nr:phosphoglycerate dehydrogenase [Clostridia bacterium]